MSLRVSAIDGYEITVAVGKEVVISNSSLKSKVANK